MNSNGIKYICIRKSNEIKALILLMTTWINFYVYLSLESMNERQPNKNVNNFLNWYNKFVDAIWSLISCFSFCSRFAFTGNWSLCRYNYYCYYFNKYFSTECRFSFVSKNRATLYHFINLSFYFIVLANVLNYLRDFRWWRGLFSVWVYLYSLSMPELRLWPINFRFRIVEWMVGYYNNSIWMCHRYTIYVRRAILSHYSSIWFSCLLFFWRLSICMEHMNKVELLYYLSTYSISIHHFRLNNDAVCGAHHTLDV